MISTKLGSTGSVLLALTISASAQAPPGEGPALGTNRTTQADITGGGMTLLDIRKAGLKIFATPFNKLDGYGDGPENLADTTSPGGRPTLQNNGTFLRVNGLDAQNCQECHSVGSNATVPFTFAIGGVGGSNNNAIFQPTEIDVDDTLALGHSFFNGRYINPPFLFGSGGVELLGKEMTADLQVQKALAMSAPGTSVPLVSKGVSFGTISFSSVGVQDSTGIEGVDDDLVVKPFGRKGDNATVRQFDIGALQFHMGMQPSEAVGAGIDGDGDGVVDEILIGELSALHIFGTNLERPKAEVLTGAARLGSRIFRQIGCSGCHVPNLTTLTTNLTYSQPEIHDDPLANVFYAADLAAGPAGFATTLGGGIKVPLFSDLKRHDMGLGLKETFGHPLDDQFVTARLWGIADTAPYMHDGRATTLTEAILLHGGEALAVRNSFDALSDIHKIAVLTFLRTLRTPTHPAQDLL
ncbi:MAG: di-heme oxidoredictase family protein [bacterium]|nr:hypothetical protein [Planctomycetota bacterium]HIL50898.1 hypothetical protein [Planctomycetota bacterium]